MSQSNLDARLDSNEVRRPSDGRYHSDLELLFANQPQRIERERRVLSKTEQDVIATINNCFKNWHQPWRESFLTAGREFKIVYELMEGLLHYEYQITNSDSVLSSDRTNAISQAVARLVDYGNAILNIDLIIRVNDEATHELDSSTLTTIELFQAHVKAHCLREKLLYDYFMKDKPDCQSSPGNDDQSGIIHGSMPAALTTMHLVVPTTNQSPTLERSQRSMNSSSTSINTISDGRRTPQGNLPFPIFTETKLDPAQFGCHIEISHMSATMRANSFLSSPNTRLTLLPEVLAKIESLITSVPTNFEKTTQCFELLDTLLDVIERLPIESREREVTMIVSKLLKPTVRKVYIDDRDNLVEFQHSHWTTCLLSMIRLMTANDFNIYLRNFNNLTDLGAFLKDYLFIIKRLISTSDLIKNSTRMDIESIKYQDPTYPNCWIEMILLASSTFLTSLTYIYQVLRQIFSSNQQIWLSFIDCLCHFILQDALRPDRVMLKRRQCLLADDLRQTAAEYVWISWDCLSLDLKKQLIEDLIELLVRSCMILDSRQRSILMPIFYDMMRCDFTSQYITPRGSDCDTISLQSRKSFCTVGEDDLASLPSNSQSKTNESLPYLIYNDASEDGTVLTKFTHLLVGKLNLLVNDLGLGDESFKTELCAALSGELNPKYYNANSNSSPATDTTQFKGMAKQTSGLISEFLQICLDSRDANRLSYNHLYLLCLFKLVLFFRDKVDRPELYLSNLYKLCCLHHGAARYVEAGYTLLEHAKTLPWSDRPLENHLRVVTRFFQIQHQLTNYSSLKIFLYNTIIEYFDQGQNWEAAIPLCRELVEYHESKTYDYIEVAATLQKMSNFFSNIVDLSKRNVAEYFRVTFYGNGFPVVIRGTTMVYRGKPYEKLGDFQATMLNKYPETKLLQTLAKPDENLLNDAAARYLQINACSPIVDLRAKFGSDLDKMGQPILNYYKFNECDKFSFSRRISCPTATDHGSDKNNDESFANIWRERTTLTTNTLPGMLPFFPVYLIETTIVRPIESAIEDLERTNDRLSCMVNRFKADKRHVEDARLLGQLLLGVVDAAVNGGITKYEEAFFEQERPTNVRGGGGSFAAPKVVSIGGARQEAIEGGDQHPDLDEPSLLVDKLKCLIAQQVPLLDEAIRLHRDRVADVMRPQHEHLETSYKKLKNHVMTKYHRYLPADYNRSSIRSYRSLARSPNRSMHSESRVQLGLSPNGLSSRLMLKRMSDTGIKKSPEMLADSEQASSSIPYRQLNSERASLPFLTGITAIDRDALREIKRQARRLESDTSPVAETIETSCALTRPTPATRSSLMDNIMRKQSFNGPFNQSGTKHLYTRLICDNGQDNDGHTEPDAVGDTSSFEPDENESGVPELIDDLKLVKF